jgi:hypothetical protein
MPNFKRRKKNINQNRIKISNNKLIHHQKTKEKEEEIEYFKETLK